MEAAWALAGKRGLVLILNDIVQLITYDQDAIDFYTRKLAKTEAAVQDWREKSETNKVENYGFVSLVGHFNSYKICVTKHTL
jgi:hypothetical protein